MAVAPEPYLNASLHVLYRAAVTARMWGYSGSVDPGKLADLMDAIHNIPGLIANWEDGHEQIVRNFLEDYDQRWPDAAFLVNSFEDALLEPRCF